MVTYLSLINMKNCILKILLFFCYRRLLQILSLILHTCLRLLFSIFSMDSKSSTPNSSTASSCHAIIVDDFPSVMALVRNRRGGGRLHSLGSISNRTLLIGEVLQDQLLLLELGKPLLLDLLLRLFPKSFLLLTITLYGTTT